MARTTKTKKPQERMRLMGLIRSKGQFMLTAFLVIFLISVFAGLGLGMFNFGGPAGSNAANMSRGPLPRVTVDNTGALKDVPMLVNGKPVDREYFDVLAANYVNMYARGNDDPMMTLMAYGAAAGRALRQEFTLQLAEELKVTVTKEDIEAAKNEVIDQYLSGSEQKKDAPAGNILGDLAKNLSGSRERQDAFARYLESQNLKESEWLKRVRREQMERNTEKALQDEANEKKKVEMNEKRALVDQRLSEGTAFEDVVREFSEDPDTASIEKGGDVGTWVFRGLLTIPEQEEVLFAAKKGEVTDWIEIPAGLQKFEVYDKVEASGPEFEAAKAELIAKIKEEKGADYEPTEDEIAAKHEKVKFRKLQLSNEEPGAAQEEISRRFETAKIEINDPYVLAYQLLLDQKLQPASTLSYDKLVEIAKTAPVGEGYKFELIQAKLDNGVPKTEEELAEEEAEAEAAEAGEDAAADAAVEEASADAAVADDEAAAEEPAEGETPKVDIELPADMPIEAEEEEAMDASKPVYALTIGLLTAAVTSQGDEVVGVFPYQIIADTYMQWLDDETVKADQPIDREKARAEVEKYYSRAAERDTYNAMLHARRGLNLAWLEKPEEAKASLEKALEYAPEQLGGALDIVKEGYEVLDDDAGIEAVDARIDKIRQDQLQQQLQQAMQQQQQTGQPQSFDIQGGPSGDTAVGGTDSGSTAAPEGEATPDAGSEAAPDAAEGGN